MNQILKTVSVGHCVSCETETQVHEICIKCAIKLGQDNPRWISVKEQSPQGECLMIGYQNEMIIGYASCTGDDYFCETEGTILNSVTHWMALPPPPPDRAVGGF